jgi:hypothetical protein
MALTKIPGSLIDTASGINGLIYPSSDGTSGQFLTTDGSGTLSFATVTTYTDSDVETYLDGGTSTPTFSTATVSGTLTVTGDLDLTGDINSYNVTDLDITDQTITLGAGQTEALSGGSGIIIDGSGASILWDETNSEFDINNPIHVAGGLHVESSTNGAVQIEVDNQNTGNASYAGLYLNGQGNDFFIKNWGDQVPGKSNQTEFISTSNGSHFVFTTASTERLRIDSSGDVIIGSTFTRTSGAGGTSTGSLSVEGTNTVPAIDLVNTTTTTGKAMRIVSINDGGLAIEDLDNSNARVLYIDSNGYTVLGDADNSATRQGYLSVMSPSTISSGFNDIAEFLAPSQAGGGVSLNIGVANSTRNLAKVAFNYSGTSGSTTNSLGLGFYAADNLLVVRADGNVGIGETSPDDKLHIKTASGDTALRFENSAGNNSRLILDSSNNTILEFNSTPRIVIDSNGNIGMGASPSGSHRLEVTGDIKATGQAVFTELEVQRNLDYAGIWFNGNISNRDSNHVLWNDYYGGPDARGSAGSGTDGIIWNTYDKFLIQAGTDGAQKVIESFRAAGVAGSGTFGFRAYYNNSEQIATTSAGVNITGDLNINNITTLPILQVAQYTVGGSTTTNSTTYVDVGNSISFTPKSSSSKLLIMHGVQTWYGSTSVGAGDMSLRFLINGSTIFTNSRALGNFDGGNQARSHAYLTHYFTYDNTTTSALTIKTQAKMSSTGVPGGLNYYHINSPAEGYEANLYIIVEYGT